MPLPKFIALGILAAVCAHGQITAEHLKSLTGSRIGIQTKQGGKAEGRLTLVTADLVTIDSLTAPHYPVQVAIGDIDSIDARIFRGSRTDRVLRKAGTAAIKVSGAALYYPGILMELPAAAVLPPHSHRSRVARILHKTSRATLGPPSMAVAIPGYIMIVFGVGLIHPDAHCC